MTEIPLEQQLEMFYPTLELHDEKGLVPNINLPLDYEARVKRFYEQGRKTEIEDYSRRLQQKMNSQSLLGFPWEIILAWDDRKGLTTIKIGTGGFDLVTDGWPHFSEHNLGGNKSMAAFFLATKYVSELIKS